MDTTGHIKHAKSRTEVLNYVDLFAVQQGIKFCIFRNRLCMLNASIMDLPLDDKKHKF